MEPINKIIKIINETNKHILLSGQAGTGKSYLTKQLITYLDENDIHFEICGTTGVASKNVNGFTLNSTFRIPPLENEKDMHNYINHQISMNHSVLSLLKDDFRPNKNNNYNGLKVLIIDEISMLSPLIFNFLNIWFQKIMGKKVFFGGVQLILVGDFLQLPPISKDKNKESMFIFEDDLFSQLDIEYIHLTKVYRQDNIEFLKYMDKLRKNEIDDETFNYFKNFDIDNKENYLKLVATNEEINQYNQIMQQQINEDGINFKAIKVNEFSKTYQDLRKTILVDDDIILKSNDKVMLMINLPEKKLVNGQIGTIIEINNKNEVVIDFDGYQTIIEPKLWEVQNIYYDDKNEKHKEIICQYHQLPLRLAYAITTHKSQGLTLQELEIDCKKFFSPGQFYTAVSRIKDPKKLIIKNLSKSIMYSNQKAVDFYKNLN